MIHKPWFIVLVTLFGLSRSAHHILRKYNVGDMVMAYWPKADGSKSNQQAMGEITEIFVDSFVEIEFHFGGAIKHLLCKMSWISDVPDLTMSPPLPTLGQLEEGDKVMAHYPKSKSESAVQSDKLAMGTIIAIYSGPYTGIMEDELLDIIFDDGRKERIPWTWVMEKVSSKVVPEKTKPSEDKNVQRKVGIAKKFGTFFQDLIKLYKSWIENPKTFEEDYFNTDGCTHEHAAGLFLHSFFNDYLANIKAERNLRSFIGVETRIAAKGGRYVDVFRKGNPVKIVQVDGKDADGNDTFTVECCAEAICNGAGKKLQNVPETDLVVPETIYNFEYWKGRTKHRGFSTILPWKAFETEGRIYWWSKTGTLALRILFNPSVIKLCWEFKGTLDNCKSEDISIPLNLEDGSVDNLCDSVPDIFKSLARSLNGFDWTINPARDPEVLVKKNKKT